MKFNYCGLIEGDTHGGSIPEQGGRVGWKKKCLSLEGREAKIRKDGGMVREGGGPDGWIGKK